MLELIYILHGYFIVIIPFFPTAAESTNSSASKGTMWIDNDNYITRTAHENRAYISLERVYSATLAHDFLW